MKTIDETRKLMRAMLHGALGDRNKEVTLFVRAEVQEHASDDLQPEVEFSCSVLHNSLPGGCLVRRATTTDALLESFMDGLLPRLCGVPAGAVGCHEALAATECLTN